MPEINEDDFYTMVEVNCATGEHIRRRLTDEERQDLENQRELYESQLAISAAKEAERREAQIAAVAKLQALGLTEEEIKALTGN